MGRLCGKATLESIASQLEASGGLGRAGESIPKRHVGPVKIRSPCEVDQCRIYMLSLALSLRLLPFYFLCHFQLEVAKILKARESQ